MPIYSQPNFKEAEPDFGIDREKLPEGEYYVLSWIQLPTIIEEYPNKEIRTFEFPLFSFSHKVITKPADKRLFYVFAVARRIRNYLASQFDFRMPLNMKFIGKDLLLPQIFASEYLPSSVGMTIMYKEPKILKDEFSSKHNKTKELLNKIHIDSFLDKAINLYGSSIWTEDIIDSFMYRWRIIELVANEEISKFSKADLGNFGNFLEEDEMKKILNKKLHVLDKIKITLRKLVPETDVQNLNKYYDLRNQIAHGDITLETYEKVGISMEFIGKISHDLLKLKIKSI